MPQATHHKMLLVLPVLVLTAGTLPVSGARAQTAPSQTGSAHSQSPAPGTAAERRSGPSVDQLMNRTAIGSDGARIGTVTDVILDPGGEARLIVIHSGGLLGIGGKDIAVDLALTEIQPDSDSIKLHDVTMAGVREMPEFRYDDSVTSLTKSPAKHAQ